MTTMNDTQAFKFFEQYGEYAVFKKVSGSHHFNWFVRVNLIKKEFNSASLTFAIVCAANEHEKECKRLHHMNNILRGEE